MTIDEFFTALRDTGVEFHVTKRGYIRASRCRCPVAALAHYNKCEGGSFTSTAYMYARSELGLSHQDTGTIFEAADLELSPDQLRPYIHAAYPRYQEIRDRLLELCVP